ncbi:MAG TPA: ABC transporter permease [Acidimicrobiia bacterium]|nr:ABC transporter permease [Acidimicrobiia bacterium]
MNTALLTRRYLNEYTRRPVNLVLLIAVPLIFVTLAAGALADFAGIVGGIGDPDVLASPTAGWAAAFLAGVAGFFHVLGSRSADRRLAAAGLRAGRIVAARLLSGLVLALIAAGAALGALALRIGIADPLRAAAGTVMLAVIYLAIGTAIGALVRSEVNGSLVVIFVWMLDVFLGPAMAGGDVWLTRLFPSHYVTLVMLDAASGHSGPLGDLGWALIWAAGSVIVAALIFASATAHREVAPKMRPTSLQLRRLRAGLRYGFRDYRRNVAMWVLLVALPVFFISLSFYITPDGPTPVELIEGGLSRIRFVSMIDVHGAIMVPITIGFLAGLAGLFIVQGSIEADRRLALAGFRARDILASRLGVIAIAALLTTGASLAVTAVDFAPDSWIWFSIGNVLVALTYGLVGVLVGAVFGRLGGLYVMFLLPFIDVGIAQNVMFSAAPPDWGLFLPGRGAVRLLVDGAFTPGFDEGAGLMLALGWLVALGLVVSVVFRRIAQPGRV